MTETTEPTKTITKQALDTKQLNDLTHEIWVSPRTKEFSEFDSRRELTQEGIFLLQTAIAVTTKQPPNLPRGVERLTAFQNFTRQAYTSEQAIIEMQKLILGQQSKKKATWEAISLKRLRAEETVNPPKNDSQAVTWGINVSSEYEWYLKLTGFQLGLEKLGLKISPNNTLVPATPKNTDEILKEIPALPTADDFFIKTQFPRIKAKASLDK